MADSESNHSCASSVSHPWAWLDRLGMGLAMICAVHCLLTPVLVICLPLIATSFWTNQDFHLWMLGLVAPLTILSLFLGCRKHHDRWMIVLGSLGVILLIAGITFGFFDGHQAHACGQACTKDISFLAMVFPHGIESFLTNLGGFCLVCTHVRNYRLCRSTSCSHAA